MMPAEFVGFENPHQNFTMVPNALLDDVVRQLNEAELKLLLYITRRTIGFIESDGRRVKDTRLSIPQFSKAYGLSQSTIRRALHSLCDRNLIGRRRETGENGAHEASSFWLRLKGEQMDDDPSKPDTSPPSNDTVPPLSRGTVLYKEVKKELLKEKMLKETSSPPTPSSSLQSQTQSQSQTHGAAAPDDSSDTTTGEIALAEFQARFKVHKDDMPRIEQADWSEWPVLKLREALQAWRPRGSRPARDFLDRHLPQARNAKFKPNYRPRPSNGQSYMPARTGPAPTREERAPQVPSAALIAWDENFRAKAPHCKIIGTGHHGLLAECLQDEEFRVHSEALIEKLEFIHDYAGGDWKPGLMWSLTKNKTTGIRNWYAVVAGEHDPKLSAMEAVVMKLRMDRKRQKAAV